MTDIMKCPICDVEFKPADLCADDIEMGTCHAKCLEGSPVVDLDTGEELPEGSKPGTYLFAELDGQKPFAWYWYDTLGCLYMTGDARKPQVPADAKPLYERPAPPPQAHSRGWQPIETAPKDGTRILIWFVHTNARFSKDPVSEGWAAAHEAYWIDHNNGGWTWHGLCGAATLWQPLPAPPATTEDQENG